LTAKIAVIHIQRQKGIERLQALKSAKKTQNWHINPKFYLIGAWS
jgi:hypothetical protein